MCTVTTPTYTFDRLFSLSHWYKTKAWRVIFYSVIAGVLFSLQIVCALYLLGLCETRGVLELDGPPEAYLLPILEKVGVVNQLTPEAAPTITSTRFDDLGLVPLAVENHGNLLGNVTTWLVTHVTGFRSNFESLLYLLIAIAVLGLLRYFIVVQSRLLADQISLQAVNGIRRSIHRQALRLGPSDLRDHARNDLVQLFTTELDLVRNNLSEWMFRVTHHPVIMVVLAVTVLCINWRLTLLCGAPLVGCWYIVHREYRRWAKMRELTESRSASQARLLSESLHKTRLVRAFGMEHFEHEQFQVLLQRFQDTALKVARGEQLNHWFCYAVAVAGVTLVVYLLGIKVMLPMDQPQHMLLASAIIMSLAYWGMKKPLEELSETPSLTKAISIYVDKSYRYLDQIPEVGQAVGAKFIEPLSKQLEFENITYRLPNQKDRVILDRFDLKIPAHSVTAIISNDPLGTRALAYLLPRFIEPQSGRVMFDGEDIAWGTLDSLRAETVFIGEQDRFFTGTVLQNITCGNPEYSLNKAIEAAKQVHAHHFITRLPQGYETMLGEHGEILDVGRAFRLTLARAALRNPALLIIEEPKTTLDDETKAHIDDAYSRLFPNRTVILIPNRLSTLKKADRVILINKGRIEVAGSQQELVQHSAIYRHWEYTQFNTFRQYASDAEAG
jgi:ABC-type multidrug transport system fused ATPase/permease subunit